MDEPTASLDFGNQVRVLGEIEHLAGRGMAIMLSTHDPDHAFLCAHRVALLHQGRLARLGPPDEVITRESLREVYGVEVTVMEVAGADGPRGPCLRSGPGRDGARRTTSRPIVSPDSSSALRLFLQVAVVAAALRGKLLPGHGSGGALPGGYKMSGYGRVGSAAAQEYLNVKAVWIKTV